LRAAVRALALASRRAWQISHPLIVWSWSFQCYLLLPHNETVSTLEFLCRHRHHRVWQRRRRRMC
jgi:hypothetical protein